MSLQIVTKHLNGEISVKNDTFIENNTNYFGAKFTIVTYSSTKELKASFVNIILI